MNTACAHDSAAIAPTPRDVAAAVLASWACLTGGTVTEIEPTATAVDLLEAVIAVGPGELSMLLPTQMAMRFATDVLGQDPDVDTISPLLLDFAAELANMVGGTLTVLLESLGGSGDLGLPKVTTSVATATANVPDIELSFLSANHGEFRATFATTTRPRGQGGVNRRSNLRVPPDAETVARVTLGSRTAIGLLVNESDAGCQLVIKQVDLSLEEGCHVRISLGDTHVRGTVRWSRAVEDLMRVGIEYATG